MTKPSEDPLIGRKLSNYHIQRLLGRGGMAQVYYGMDVKLQRPVAIKVIDARHRGKPAYAQRFIKEARIIAKWRHENIVQIYYADDENGLYYYAMEYINGKDLAETLHAHAVKNKRLPEEEILRIGSSLARALDHAHANGIIHRDVKPSNVLISKEGRIVLSDFGLALDMEEGSSGEVLGTPHYISPEQARRSTDAVPQSDLYSLGVILYEMLTGVVPFDDISPTSVALQHISQKPPAPRSINPQINPETEAVLLKALSKSPKERYQSGEQLISALEKALAKRKPASAKMPLPPPPAAVITGKTRDVNRRITPSAAAPKPKRAAGWLFLLLLLGALAFFYWRGWIPSGILPARPTLTPAPTQTALPSLPPTALALPALTQTSPPPSLTPIPPTATDTPKPSPTFTATPTVSLTPSPSVTASPAATATLAPTADPSALASPTSALPYVNAKRLWLYYDNYGFYLYNASPDNRSISPLGFQSIQTPSNAFQGFLWAEFYPTLHPGRCMKIEIQQNPNAYLNPPLCKDYYLSARSLPEENELVFWTDEFSVLWQGQEVGRCQPADGFCEVFIP